MAHAKWSPSNMEQNTACNGSAVMQEGCTDKTNTTQDEGNAVHWFSEQHMTVGGVAVGSVAPNGVVLSQEMVDHAEAYTNSCLSLNGEHHIEETVAIRRIHLTDCWGTPDHWCLVPEEMTLYVDDLKYGWGIIEPYMNKQLMAYASGIIDSLGISDQTLTVCLRIHQPRPWHAMGSMRKWRFPAEELRTHINQIHTACNSVNPTLCTGKHCKHCLRILECPANRLAAMNAVDIAEWPVGTEQSNIGREIEILRYAHEILGNRLSALEGEAIELIKSGSGVSGWSMEHGQGRVNWTTDTATMIALGEIMGCDLRNPKPITPAQAKKKGFPAELVKQNSQLTLGKYKLVPTSKTIAGKAFTN